MIFQNFSTNFEEIPENGKIEEHVHGFKLGWIQGVLIPCLLNIWGVMLFLRMPWIVAQSGLFQAVVIIVISTAVCGLTTLSLSALCTNGEVKGGMCKLNGRALRIRNFIVTNECFSVFNYQSSNFINLSKCATAK